MVMAPVRDLENLDPWAMMGLEWLASFHRVDPSYRRCLVGSHFRFPKGLSLCLQRWPWMEPKSR